MLSTLSALRNYENLSNSDERNFFYINATKNMEKSVENYNYFKLSCRILW